MKNTKVTMRTTAGDIQLELYADKAPETVKNFLMYVDEGHYNGVIFHRVIDGFMIQGGGFNQEMREKPTHAPIKNEATNQLSNEMYTIAMARTSEPHSASAQFFINVANNGFLDHKSATPAGYGYCVFGKVIAGTDVVDKIKKVKTGSQKGHQDVPNEPVEIKEIVRS